jgi:hypothetical protein
MDDEPITGTCTPKIEDVAAARTYRTRGIAGHASLLFRTIAVVTGSVGVAATLLDNASVGGYCLCIVVSSWAAAASLACIRTVRANAAAAAYLVNDGDFTYVVDDTHVVVRSNATEYGVRFNHYDSASETRTHFVLRHCGTATVLPKRAFTETDIGRLRAAIARHRGLGTSKVRSSPT